MKRLLPYLLILAGALILFVPYLGAAHLFDWDEINFAECAREMITTGNYLRVQIDYQPFWEKPPLFIWLQVLSMKVFGINEFAARFPNALAGAATLCSLYYIGKRTVSEKMARLWVLLYAASWLPFFYFKSGIIDPVFNLFIFLAFFQAHCLRLKTKKSGHALLAGFFLGLATLTKGPVALLVAGLCLMVYIILQRGFGGFTWKSMLLLALSAFLTTASWFAVEILLHGWDLVGQFITYQIRLLQTEDAGHGGPFFYHFLILLLGCFPASVFLLQRHRVPEREQTRDFTRWMWILFWVVLLLFSIVKTKIVHYSSLCYFPLTYLAALQLYRYWQGQAKMPKWLVSVALVTGSLLGIAILLMPLVGMNKTALIPYIADPFAVGNLEADVPWSLAECLWGLFYLTGLWTSLLLLRRKLKDAFLLLCIVQLIIMEATVIHFTPKIEAYSQRAAIEFYKQFQGKDVLVYPLGFKSYAHLFYTQKQPPQDGMHPTQDELLNGPVSKPVYFVSKIMDAEKYGALPQLEEIGRKNGFVFYKRR